MFYKVGKCFFEKQLTFLLVVMGLLSIPIQIAGICRSYGFFGY